MTVGAFNKARMNTCTFSKCCEYCIVCILMPKWESTLRGPSLPRMIGVVHSCPHCCPQCCHCCQSIHYHCLSLTPCPTTGPVLAATEGLTRSPGVDIRVSPPPLLLFQHNRVMGLVITRSCCSFSHTTLLLLNKYTSSILSSPLLNISLASAVTF